MIKEEPALFEKWERGFVLFYFTWYEAEMVEGSTVAVAHPVAVRAYWLIIFPLGLLTTLGLVSSTNFAKTVFDFSTEFLLDIILWNTRSSILEVVDPGFTRWETPTPEVGRQPIILQTFCR